MNDFRPAADEIRALARVHPPRVGLVLGSGLETVVDSIDQCAAIAYDALPGVVRLLNRFFTLLPNTAVTG